MRVDPDYGLERTLSLHILPLDQVLECVCRDLELVFRGSQIISDFCRDDLGRVGRNLDLLRDGRSLMFCICCSGDLWNTKSLIWVSRPTLTNILLLLQGWFGARLPKSGPGVHGRRSQIFVLFYWFVTGAIWSAFAVIWTWDSQRTLTNILRLLQGWPGLRLPRSVPGFHGRRSQIFFFCSRGDLERVCRNLDLGFTADAHKYSSLVCRGDLVRVCRNLDLGFTADAHKYSAFVSVAIWSAAVLQCWSLWPGFYGGHSQKFFSCCRSDLERVCRNLDLVFSASAHQYSTFVAGAIWSAFPRSGPSFRGRRSQIFFSCWRGDLERVCRNLDLGFTADALIPNEHRGRLNLLEFQRYFARLPDSIIFKETSTSSYESLKKKG